MAEELVRTLGYDCGRFHLSASPIINVVLRAKKLDQVARQVTIQALDAASAYPAVSRTVAGHRSGSTMSNTPCR
jgi:hypothetical protein